MQDTFLSNSSDDERQDKQLVRKKVPCPNRKIYKIQIPFFCALKKELEDFQFGIQKQLHSLTSYQEGQTKRLPYTIFRSMEKSLRELRQIKKNVIQENRKMALPVSEREKVKQQKNATFQKYLKTLNQTRHELKAYISRLEARVQKMEDNGYAQYVDYEVVVPEINTIRFSFCPNSSLRFVDSRDSFVNLVAIEIEKHKKLFSGKECTQILSLLHSKDLKLYTCLKIYEIYRYYANERIIRERIIRFRNKSKENKVVIEKMKQALKCIEVEKEKQRIEMEIKENSGKMKKTDYMIYLKGLKPEIAERLRKKIFTDSRKVKAKSSSCPK